MKKAIGTETLVIMISALVVAVVFLTILYPQWRGAFEKQTESSAECSTELLLRSVVKAVSFGFSDIPVKCQVKDVKVTEKTIDRLIPLSKQATKYYAQQSMPISKEYPDNELGWQKWAISKIVADEIVSCHRKGWEGKLDLTQTGLIKLFPEEGGQLCLYCARITYDEKITEKNIKLPLYPWLQQNLIGQRTYFDYLSSELYTIDQWKFFVENGFEAFKSLFGSKELMNKLGKIIGQKIFVSDPYVDTSQPTAVVLVIFKEGGAFATAQTLKDLKANDPIRGQVCGKIIGEV